MIRITLGILAIIASWTFGIPFSWAVAITVLSCLTFVGAIADLAARIERE